MKYYSCHTLSGNGRVLRGVHQAGGCRTLRNGEETLEEVIS